MVEVTEYIVPEQQLPPYLLEQIAQGKAILFLGAGASYDALVNSKPTRITANELGNRISNHFLNGAHKNKALRSIAGYARNEASVGALQAFIKTELAPLEPAAFHKLIPTFKWHAIVTTNYDLVIEKAYTEVQRRLQEPFPLYKDGTLMEEVFSRPKSFPLVKLHGCISNHTDVAVPLVLASEEFASFNKGRTNLVKSFGEWAREHPIIFCGYSLEDENVQQILFDLGDNGLNRPHYAFVSADLDEIQSRYWQARRMYPWKGTFEQFMNWLDSAIPQHKRTLSNLLSTSASQLGTLLKPHTVPTSELTEYLSKECQLVANEASNTVANAKAFYSGLDSSWTPIHCELDVKRAVVEELFEKAVFDVVNSTKSRFFVLLGYAGSGKSTALKRFALDATQLMDAPLVLYLGEGSILRSDLIFELVEKSERRPLLILDDAIEHLRELPNFLARLSKKNQAITIVCGARTNEWAIYGRDLAALASAEIDIGELLRNEADALLELLAKHKCLGPLKDYSDDEKRAFLDKFAKRQLLVALHEITSGLDFEQIVIDEYEKIVPRDAQQLYLDICTLHQYRIGTRAGLLSRISGLSLEQFRNHLFSSLKEVVRIYFDNKIQDYVYLSRHDEIARIVFNLGIDDPKQRTLQLSRIIGKLDLDYAADRKAMNEIVRGKRLSSLFADRGNAADLFQAASAAGAGKTNVYLQQSIFEMQHSSGSLAKATEFIRLAEKEALQEGITDPNIQHGKANLLRRKAEVSSVQIEKDRFRSEARALLKPLLYKRNGTHAEHLYGQLILDEIKDQLTSDQFNLEVEATPARQETVVNLVATFEDVMAKGFQTSPHDDHLAALQADLYKTLGNFPKALQILELYQAKQKHNSFLAVALARHYQKRGELPRAIQLLRATLVASPSDKLCAFALAKALIEQSEHSSSSEIGSLLRRSFSPGDSHYDARFWYARYCLLFGDVTLGEREFESLSKVHLEPGQKRQLRGSVRSEDGTPTKFEGTVTAKFPSYCFLRTPNLRFAVFAHAGAFPGKSWYASTRGSQVTFRVKFSFMGPRADSVTVAD